MGYRTPGVSCTRELCTGSTVSRYTVIYPILIVGRWGNKNNVLNSSSSSDTHTNTNQVFKKKGEVDSANASGTQTLKKGDGKTNLSPIQCLKEKESKRGEKRGF